jgi:hypothetical protein
MATFLIYVEFLALKLSVRIASLISYHPHFIDKESGPFHSTHFYYSSSNPPD